MNILLVDATAFQTTLSPELLSLKDRYFRIKKHIKDNYLGNYVSPSPRSFSMGLLRVATLLKTNGINVRYTSIFDDVIKIFKEESFDIVAFSAICPTFNICVEITKEIRSIAKRNIRVVVGGAHINVARDITIKRYGTTFDSYVNGYESNVITQIVGKEIKLIKPNGCYVDYSLLPLPLFRYSISTFRTIGCSYNCQYCQDKLIPQFERDIVCDMRTYMKLLPKGSLIHFFDSTIIGKNYQNFEMMCKNLESMQHGMHLSCEIRSEQIGENSIMLLEKAGFSEIRVGVESSDYQVLSSVNRRNPIENIERKFTLVKEISNMYISIYILSGLLGSTIESSSRTRELVCRYLEDNVVDEVKNGIYVPYPIDGVNYSKQGIFVLSEDWNRYDRQKYPVYHLKNMSSDNIWEDFILTTKNIVKTWEKASGITNETIKNTVPFSEYNVLNYRVR